MLTAEDIVARQTLGAGIRARIRKDCEFALRLCPDATAAEIIEIAQGAVDAVMLAPEQCSDDE